MRESLEESMKYSPSIKGEIWLEENEQSWIGQTEREIEKSCRDAGIIGIENGTVIYSPDMARLEIKNALSEHKLSDLRGKHTKQTEQEIDKQIWDLRDEWER